MSAWQVLVQIAGVASIVSCAGASSSPAGPSSSVVPPVSPASPPKALETATITIVADGFRLDSASSAAFKIDELRLYKGGRLTFVNQDTVPHDIQSDPPHIHTECPEIGGAGFLVPGQSKPTDPLDRLVSCGFHDHHHEGDRRYSGRVTVEAR
jgi:hypothetical protein